MAPFIRFEVYEWKEFKCEHSRHSLSFKNFKGNRTCPWFGEKYHKCLRRKCQKMSFFLNQDLEVWEILSVKSVITYLLHIRPQKSAHVSLSLSHVLDLMKVYSKFVPKSHVVSQPLNPTSICLISTIPYPETKTGCVRESWDAFTKTCSLSNKILSKNNW